MAGILRSLHWLLGRLWARQCGRVTAVREGTEVCHECHGEAETGHEREYGDCEETGRRTGSASEQDGHNQQRDQQQETARAERRGDQQTAWDRLVDGGRVCRRSDCPQNECDRYPK